MTAVTIPVIETERLILRGPLDSDIAPLASFITDPDFGRYIPQSTIVRPLQERSERTLAMYRDRWAGQPLSALGWMIARKADGAFMGIVGIEYEADLGGAELDYRLGKPYWGQGYATEAARACVRYGFEQVNWDPIVAWIVPENTGSQHVLERLGFVYERDGNYLEMAGNPPTLAFDYPVVAGYTLARARFAPGDAYYRVEE